MEGKIRLEPELRERIDREVLKRIDLAVSDCAQRDRDLLELREALKGLPTESGSEPWPGACKLVDPLLREHHTTVVAAMVAQLRQPPFWIVEGTEPGADTSSSVVESWLSTKAQQCDYGTALYEAAYNAAAYKFAPLYVGWIDEMQKTRQMMFEDQETGELVYEQDQVPGREYKKQNTVRQSVLGGRVYYKSILPWDYYLYPSNALNAREASAVIQRVAMTREQLLAGIRDYGFEQDAVMEIIRTPPAKQSRSGSNAARDIDEQNGISATINYDAPIECYVVYGRLPLLLDNDEIATPEHLLNEDFVWWVCPDALDGVVFKFTPWELPERPYAVCGIMPEPGTNSGESVLTFLREMGDEATVMVRLMMNSASLEVCPTLVVPKNREADFDNKSLFPGGVLGEVNANEIRPLTWDMRGPQMAMQMLEYLNGRASQLIATKNYGEVGSGKVRKATEIQAAESMMAAKFDLFLQNFQQPGLADIARLMIMYYVSRGGTQQQGDVEITREVLDSRFRFTPHAATGAADPMTRMALTRAKIEAQTEYHSQFVQGVAAIAQGLMPPEVVIELLSQAYHGKRRALEDTGERDIESWLGRDPEGWLTEMVGQQQPQMPQMPGQQGGQIGQSALQPAAGAGPAGAGGNGAAAVGAPIAIAGVTGNGAGGTGAFQ